LIIKWCDGLGGVALGVIVVIVDALLACGVVDVGGGVS
jgi:hypothetical protein